MKNKTLAEKVSRSFSKVKLKKASVKVPKLKVGSGKQRRPKIDDEMPTSSIISILIRSAVERAKREKKEKKQQDFKNYSAVKEERVPIVNGGYGTISKHYGASHGASYADYGKLFSYLGKFKAKGPYENRAEHLKALNKLEQDRGFVLIDADTLDKGARDVKYLYHPGRFDMYTALTSLVAPMGDMSSAEWEQFKLTMIIDKVMYSFKTRTA